MGDLLLFDSSGALIATNQAGNGSFYPVKGVSAKKAQDINRQIKEGTTPTPVVKPITPQEQQTTSLLTPQEQQTRNDLLVRDAKNQETYPMLGRYDYVPLRTPEEISKIPNYDESSNVSKPINTNDYSKDQNVIVKDQNGGSIVFGGTGQLTIPNLNKEKSEDFLQVYNPPSPPVKESNPNFFSRTMDAYNEIEYFTANKVTQPLIAPIKDVEEKTGGTVMIYPIPHIEYPQSIAENKVFDIYKGIRNEPFDKPLTTGLTFAVGAVVGGISESVAFTSGGVKALKIANIVGTTAYIGGTALSIVGSPNKEYAFGGAITNLGAFSLGAGLGSKAVSYVPEIKPENSLFTSTNKLAVSGAKGTVTREVNLGVADVKFGKSQEFTQYGVMNNKGYGVSQTKMGDVVTVSKSTPEIVTSKTYRIGKNDDLKFVGKSSVVPLSNDYVNTKNYPSLSKNIEYQTITDERTILVKKSLKVKDVSAGYTDIKNGRTTKFSSEGNFVTVQNLKGKAFPELTATVTKERVFDMNTGRGSVETTGASYDVKRVKFVKDKVVPETKFVVGMQPLESGTGYKFSRTTPVNDLQVSTTEVYGRGTFSYKKEPYSFSMGKKAQVSSFGEQIPKGDYAKVKMKSFVRGEYVLPSVQVQPLETSSFFGSSGVRLLSGNLSGVMSGASTLLNQKQSSVNTQRISLLNNTKSGSKIGSVNVFSQVPMSKIAEVQLQKQEQLRVQTQKVGQLGKLGMITPSMFSQINIPETPSPPVKPGNPEWPVVMPWFGSDYSFFQKSGRNKKYVPSIVGVNFQLHQKKSSNALGELTGIGVRGI